MLNAKIDDMTYAGNVARSTFIDLQHILEPQITTKELSDQVAKCLENSYLKSECLNYPPESANPFPAPCCISVNEEVCHGIPGSRKICGGDLVSIDLALRHKDHVVDCCQTFGVGELSKEATDLNYWTKTALRRALRYIKAGVQWVKIAHIIEQTARDHGYSVIRDVHSHGVGKALHELPILRNYKHEGDEEIVLEEGQTISVEPMFTLGNGEIELLEDGWTLITKDRTLSAHWENCLMVTKNGCQVLA